ncbi:small-conductance mechanosensitive channel [Methanolobus tindarius DSM 2278]|jgi:small-conductance mechanosensitive channel|uniref:Small-conductance mechanosensitive channel n=1 Tax=Methanolobus tindarius DSM 2278 TaxID=1090322 RepID=W9DTY0_METTI|nr:mechanosensitive ion channel family protein [Methanolobus tindarius]ETA69060.1 small-conductance mechanosensitive channel [Methanolobus tindarius DSM 2278]
MNNSSAVDTVSSYMPVLSDPVLQVVTVIVILFFTIVIAKGITIYLQRSLKDKMDKEHLNILIKSIYYGAIVLSIVGVIFPLLNIDTSGLLVAGGVVGIVIGFASQSIVGNFISGVFLMIERPIKIGDQVNIDNKLGYVEDIKIISTIIRTYDGLYIRLPNETVFTTSITNYVANLTRRFEYIVGIRYSDDADEAIKIIKDIIEMEPFALVNPGPSVFVDTLGDNAVNIIVRIWAPATHWYDMKMKLLWVIKKTLEDNGIEIAFPQRTVWFASELETRKMNSSCVQKNTYNDSGMEIDEA